MYAVYEGKVPVLAPTKVYTGLLQVGSTGWVLCTDIICVRTCVCY